MIFQDKPLPTHCCRVCGAFWRFWPERDTGRPDSWNLMSKSAGDCCKDAYMGEQIRPATYKDLFAD